MSVPTFNIPSQTEKNLKNIVNDNNINIQNNQPQRTKEDFFSDVKKMIDSWNFSNRQEAILETAKYANSKWVQYEWIDYNQIFQSYWNKQKQIKEPEQDVSGFDIWVSAWKWLSEAGRDIKVWGFELWEDKAIEWIWKTIANVPWDALEAIWETVELLSDPIWASKWILDFWQWLSDKLVFWLLNKITGKDVPATEKSKIADAVWNELKENFWTKEKALETITNNPVDSILFIKGLIKTAKKVSSKWTTKDFEQLEKSLPDRLNESAQKQVEQALWAAKDKFKQKWRQIAPWIIERGITWSKEEIQQLAQSKASDYWSQIKEFVDSWKLTWTVKRDDLLNVLDNIRKEWQVWDVIVDESIVKATDNFADIISWFWKEIQADKARIIRQIFDDAVYNTKWVVSEEALSLKNRIKKDLADNIRKQLAENNPELAKINKEFNFYNTVDEVLTETLNRQWPQQWWLTTNILASWWLWAGWFIFWDITWAIATWAIVKWLSEAMKSTKWRTVSAKYKGQLARALSDWNKTEAESIAKKIIKAALWQKWNAYIWWQVTESNLENNE